MKDTTIERWRKARHDPALAVLEGFHSLKHALRFGAEVLEAATPDPAALARLAEDLAPDVAGRIGELAAVVPAGLFQRLAPRSPATGVLAIARRPPVDPSAALAAPGAAPVVLLDRPRRMGNLGAVVRVAAAAGAGAVLAIGRHDPWNPAAIRGAAGLQFALPVARIDASPESDRPLVAIDPQGERLGPGAIPPRAIVAFGTERDGLAEGILARADRRLAIPMRAGVSSLNLATAVAVTLYAWRLGAA